METYERPVVLATYSVQEVVEEAAVCVRYDNNGKKHCPPDHAKGKGGPWCR